MVNPEVTTDPFAVDPVARDCFLLADDVARGRLPPYTEPMIQLRVGLARLAVDTAAIAGESTSADIAPRPLPLQAAQGLRQLACLHVRSGLAAARDDEAVYSFDYAAQLFRCSDAVARAILRRVVAGNLEVTEEQCLSALTSRAVGFAAVMHASSAEKAKRGTRDVFWPDGHNGGFDWMKTSINASFWLVDEKLARGGQDNDYERFLNGLTAIRELRANDASLACDAARQWHGLIAELYGRLKVQHSNDMQQVNRVRRRTRLHMATPKTARKAAASPRWL